MGKRGRSYPKARKTRHHAARPNCTRPTRQCPTPMSTHAHAHGMRCGALGSRGPRRPRRGTVASLIAKPSYPSPRPTLAAPQLPTPRPTPTIAYTSAVTHGRRAVARALACAPVHTTNVSLFKDCLMPPSPLPHAPCRPCPRHHTLTPPRTTPMAGAPYRWCGGPALALTLALAPQLARPPAPLPLFLSLLLSISLSLSLPPPLSIFLSPRATAAPGSL